MPFSTTAALLRAEVTGVMALGQSTAGPRQGALLFSFLNSAVCSVSRQMMLLCLLCQSCVGRPAALLRAEVCSRDRHFDACMAWGCAKVRCLLLLVFLLAGRRATNIRRFAF